jgi:NADPH:quinone reductase-like Zn-dependent oxidoreductase
MKAVAYRKFGSTDVLETMELPLPSAPANGVLVTVHASSLNVVDSRTRRGEMSPFVNKTFPKIPGVDFAGTVSAIGAGASRYKVGDLIYGATNPFKGGAFAEVLAVKEEAIAPKPSQMDMEQAAALPLAGLAALYSLRELGKVTAGHTVLIYGSSGGVGLMAIQIAKHLGTHVTTVSGSRGVGISREMGADITHDYQSGPVRLNGPFDLVVDYSGKFPFDVARQYLKSNGRFVDPSPTIPKFIGSMLANPFRGQKQLMLTAESHRKDLEFLTSLVDSGKLKVNVAKVFSFESARHAFAELETGGTIGKLVVAIRTD